MSISEFKNLNVRVPVRTLEELKSIQDYYSDRLGVRVNQRETVIKLINEMSNLIRNTGETYPGRQWES